MEQIIQSLLLFITLAFGFILLLYSEFLRLHDKQKTERIIIGILGIMLILFFLFQGDFIEFCWESTFNIQFDSGQHTMSDWKISATNTPFWVGMSCICFVMVMVALVFFYRKNILANLRDELKDLEIFGLRVLFVYGIAYSIVFLFLCYILYQFVDGVIRFFFKLFY